MTIDKQVFSFGGGVADGDGSMAAVLGGKGAGLAEMTALGIPVPPGFTISTAACRLYFELGNTISESLKAEVGVSLSKLEEAVGKKLGGSEDPLLVSVRSGSPMSMPGMMDTVLNLGLNDQTVEAIAAKSQNPRFAYDTYRRFIQMYSNVVLGVDIAEFEHHLENVKLEVGVWQDNELDVDALKSVVRRYHECVRQHSGQAFPQDPLLQLWGAVEAVFASWNNPRAKYYRQLNNIPANMGTAVTVQAMVFGNMGADCATGVAFTRNPSTGAKEFYGEYLPNAQGEDVVAGIRTPMSLTNTGDGLDGESLESTMPEAFAQLLEIQKNLELHYRDMQDIEFTIERGHVWMLQTRRGKRTAVAAVRVAVEMVDEGLIDKREAVLRVEPISLDQLLHPTLDPSAAKTVLATGLPASPGAVSGRIVFNAVDAEDAAARGEDVILVRVETSPEDIKGMSAARGILTARGGMTSHAAVVARGMGRCCVAGCGAVRIDEHARTMAVSGHTLTDRDVLTLDGSTGEVILGRVAQIEANTSGEFARLMTWADTFRTLGVRANADNPRDAKRARRLGAEGVGLCRTEHMFFEGDRITSMRRLILARTDEERATALGSLEPMQQADFEGIFTAMLGLPVTIRLLDPPLHEFLPQHASDVELLVKLTGITKADIELAAESLHETNPMLGHRGCRLGISFPAIYEMQTRAIFRAAVAVNAEHPGQVKPEVMIPLVGHPEELRRLRALVLKVAHEVLETATTSLDFLVGTMIELPRACCVADRIAEHADFFSFGTNDLTQTTFGISRDDAASFMRVYLDQGIYEQDPFVSIDQDGLGVLMRMGVEKGRAQNAKLKIGICGEHGGEPASVRFCQSLGLDYVSCSPFRVPIARLAAAHAALTLPAEPK
ncbi:MAG: pyruvate, phosphate dikinase [Deltaproteobacteria bacterium CG2_30_63_29]|nr:MAG: pyruvate, phosphate dikinase [Deltaproteobacteria bacterium CG2_30_63_29]PJB41089.1 MAG: pyruvate, phosphate dikinase [Deltaproteobacteria bacterium CG_4_9_14_3_um_filter_63_12]